MHMVQLWRGTIMRRHCLNAGRPGVQIVSARFRAVARRHSIHSIASPMPQPSLPPADERESELTDGPSDASHAARDRRAWIGNLCVAGVLAGACVVFGSQFLDWWGRPAYSPEERERDEALSIDGGSMPPTLLYGEPAFAVEKTPYRGERPLLRDALRTICRAKADKSFTELSAQWTMLPPAGPAEIRLLEFMAGSPAIESRAGEWMMYEHRGAIPLVVVVGLPADAPLPGVVHTEETLAEAERVDSGNSDLSRFATLPRVICWAVGFAGGDREPGRFSGPEPPSPELWTVLHCWRETFSASTMTMALMPDIPSEMDRTMTLPLQGGSCLVGVKGIGSVDHWKRRFDEWFQEREGVRMWPWEEVSGAWHARYSEPAMLVDINFAVDANDRMQGMSTIAIRRHEAE